MRGYILVCTSCLKSDRQFTQNSPSQLGPAPLRVLKSPVWLVTTTLACAALNFGKLKKRKIMCVQNKILNRTHQITGKNSYTLTKDVLMFTLRKRRASSTSHSNIVGNNLPTDVSDFV